MTTPTLAALPRYFYVSCAHLRTCHSHGTRACYVLDKCRCVLCTLANRVYAKGLDNAQAQGAEAAYVDARTTLAHISALRAAGMGYRAIAKRAGLSKSTLQRLQRLQSAQRAQCRRTTRQAILAIPLPREEDILPGQQVDAMTTGNRVKALHHLGYSVAHIARHANLNRQVVDNAIHGQTITAGTQLAIKATFEQLWNRPCLVQDPTDARSIARARSRAATHHWPAPLDLEDDGSVSEIFDHSNSVDLDEFVFLLDMGETVAEATRRSGVTFAAIQKSFTRQGRTDVRRRIAQARLHEGTPR